MHNRLKFADSTPSLSETTTLVLCFVFDMALACYLGSAGYILIVEIIEQSQIPGLLVSLAAGVPLLWSWGYLHSPRLLATLIVYTLHLVMAFAYAGLIVLLLKGSLGYSSDDLFLVRCGIATHMFATFLVTTKGNGTPFKAKLSLPSGSYFNCYQSEGLLLHKKMTLFFVSFALLAMIIYEAIFPAMIPRPWLESVMLWSIGFAAHLGIMFAVRRQETLSAGEKQQDRSTSQ